MILEGRIWKFGDNIDTDIIIPARYLASTDPKVLGSHCMEPIAPDFHDRVRPGDIIVAGFNFGSGSSREHAPVALQALGIPLIVAKSFARIFYRNSFNKGLALLEADLYDKVGEGDRVQADLSSGLITSGSVTVQAKPIPAFMLELINAGGLIKHLRKRLEEQK
jgi:3-isopropylmalate/(R)-2-methylmalate dehydratase small subunit